MRISTIIRGFLVAAAGFLAAGNLMAGTGTNSVFTSVYLGAGNFDAAVGLDTNKTYFNAVNLNGGASTVNGVAFAASAGANPSGSNWSISNVGFPYNTAAWGYLLAGGLGTLVSDFIYGGNPGTVTLSNMNTGQVYILTFYSAAWDAAGNRIQTVTSSKGASIVYDEDMGAVSKGDGNLLRYTFMATEGQETIRSYPWTSATFHMYAFCTEEVFNNQWLSGANWTSATWSKGFAPNAQGANADFTNQLSPTTINLDANVTVGHVRFDGTNAWTLSGANTLSFMADTGGVSVIGVVTGVHTLGAPVNLKGSCIKFGNGTLLVTNTVTGGGNLAVGGGLMVLSGNNSHTGGITAEGGILRVDNAGSIPAGGTVLINPGGSLQATGVYNTVSAWLGSGKISPASTGAVLLVDGSENVDMSGYNTLSLGTTGSVTYTGTLTPGNAGYHLGGGGGTLTVGIALLGTNGLVMNCPGIVILPFANTNSGATEVNNGSLVLMHSNALQNSTLSLAGGTVVFDSSVVPHEFFVGNLAGSGSLSLQDNAGTPNPVALTAGGNNVSTSLYSGVLSGSGNLIKVGGGTLVLSGNNTYTADTIIVGGTLQIGNGGTSGALSTTNIVNSSSLAFSRSDTFTLSTPISGVGSLVQAGAGTLDIWTNCAFSGGTYINNGIVRLRAEKGGTLGSGPINVASGASYEVWAPSPVTLNNDIILNGLGRGAGRPALNQDGGGGKVTITGNMTLSATSDIGLGGTSQNDIEITGQITGAGGLTALNYLASPYRWYTLILSGSNSYNGDTVVGLGTVKIGNNGALPWGVGKGNVSVTGLLDIAGYSAGINGLTGAGTVDNTTGSGVLAVGNNNASSTFDGVIKNTSGTLSLVKNGNGTVVLTGANTYSGTTTINGGTLQVGSGGTSGSLGTNNIVNNGILAINRSDGVALNQSISGAGGIVRTGGGLLALTANNTYSGATVISNGTLQVGSVAGIPVSLLNSGFESPAYASGQWAYGPVGVDWTFTATNQAGVAHNNSTWYATAAPEGTQGGYVQGVGAVSQPVMITTAAMYQVTFQAEGRTSLGPNGLILKADGIQYAAWDHTYFSETEWRSCTGTVFLTEGEHTLSFAGWNTRGGDSATAIDNILIVSVPMGPQNYLSTNTTLHLDGSAWLNLAGVTQTVQKLYLDGEFMCSGTHGATGSGADYEHTNYFKGTGVLRVKEGKLGGTVIIIR